MPEVSGIGGSPSGTSPLLESERRPSQLLYHHGIRAEYAKPGRIFPQPNEGITNERLRSAYDWLTRQVGYVPLFLSAGYTNDALSITGYPHVHDTVFSFSSLPDGVFTDYTEWEKLWMGLRNTQPNREAVFHDSWTREEWLKKIKEAPGTVQGLSTRIGVTREILSYTIGKNILYNRDSLVV